MGGKSQPGYTVRPFSAPSTFSVCNNSDEQVIVYVTPQISGVSPKPDKPCFVPGRTMARQLDAGSFRSFSLGGQSAWVSVEQCAQLASGGKWQRTNKWRFMNRLVTSDAQIVVEAGTGSSADAQRDPSSSEPRETAEEQPSSPRTTDIGEHTIAGSSTMTPAPSSLSLSTMTSWTTAQIIGDSRAVAQTETTAEALAKLNLRPEVIESVLGREDLVPGVSLARASVFERLANSHFFWVNNQSNGAITVYVMQGESLTAVMDDLMAGRIAIAGNAALQIRQAWQRVQGRTTVFAVRAGGVYNFPANVSNYYVSIQRQADGKWYCVNLSVKEGHIITVNRT